MTPGQPFRSHFVLYLALWTGLAGAKRLTRSDFRLNFTKEADLREKVPVSYVTRRYYFTDEGALNKLRHQSLSVFLRKRKVNELYISTFSLVE